MDKDMAEFLSSIKSMFDDLSLQIKENTKELATLSQETKENTKELATVANDVSNIKLTLENSVSKNIDLLAEGFGSLVEKTTKLDDISDKISKLQSDMDIVKHVVTDHSVEINKLTRVK